MMNLKESKLDKLYICVLDEFPDYMTPTLVAHAVLRHHLVEEGQVELNDYHRYKAWLNDSFRKCVVRVNRKEFEKIRNLSNVVESWENNTLDGEVSCLTVISNSNEHNVLKFAKLWKPVNIWM